MRAKTTIRTSESGWVVYFNNDVNNFKVFRSDEPERFIRFITEEVAETNIDRVLVHRNAEIEKARKLLG